MTVGQPACFCISGRIKSNFQTTSPTYLVHVFRSLGISQAKLMTIRTIVQIQCPLHEEKRLQKWSLVLAQGDCCAKTKKQSKAQKTCTMRTRRTSFGLSYFVHLASYELDRFRI
jgi:hypothetical protein